MQYSRTATTHDPARLALVNEAARLRALRWARVAGTHALVLEGAGGLPVASAPGVACWTVLQPEDDSGIWQGPVRADCAELPFCDDAFSAIWVGFAAAVALRPEHIAGELARTLAPHGVLMIVDIHRGSLWRGPASFPGRWQRALRHAGLEVEPARRFGAPWPRRRGATGLPAWLARCAGGGWMLAARRRKPAGRVIKAAAVARRVHEPGGLLPGARRACP